MSPPIPRADADQLATRREGSFSGSRIDPDVQVRDTPRDDPPKTPVETELRRKIGNAVVGMANEVGYARFSDEVEAERRVAARQLLEADFGGD